MLQETYQKLEASIFQLNKTENETLLFNQPQLFEVKKSHLISATAKNLSAEQRNRLYAELEGYGPLDLLIEQEVQEIIINSPEEIWIEKNGSVKKYNDRFLSQYSFQSFVDRILHESQSVLSMESPFAQSTWKGFRLQAVSRFITKTNDILCLRKMEPSKWTLNELLVLGFLDQETARQIKSLIENRKNLLIVGSTGSGKTSLLNACLDQLPQNERCVVIEDTDELKIPNPSSIKLVSKKDPNGIYKEINLHDLLKTSLRLRPDRIVVGEVRSVEAKDLLLAISSGHDGSLSTIHANSSKQALIRLEMLIQMGAPYWSIHAIRTLIKLSLDSIIVVEKTPQGERQVKEISQLSSLEDTGFLLDYTYERSEPTQLK